MRLSSMRLIEVFFFRNSGKIGIELNFRDINKIKPYFSEKTLRKLVQ